MATISSQQFFGKGKVTNIGNEATIQENESKNGASFFGELFSDIKETGSDIKKSFMGGVEKTQQALEAGVRGEQGSLRTTGQIIGQGADVVSNIFGDVLKGAVKTILPQSAETAIKSGAEKVIDPIANSELVKNVLEKYNQLDETTKRDIEASLGIVKLGTDVAGFGVASKGAGATTKQIVKQGAKAVDMASELGKEALSSTGKVLKAGGKEVFELGVPMSAKEARLVQMYNKNVPFLERVKRAISGAESTKPITNAETAFRNVFGGTQSMIGTQALKAKDSLWNDLISPALKSSQETLTKDELFSGIVNKILKTTDPIKKASYEDAFNFIKDSYKNVDGWNMEMAQNLKQDLAEFLPQAVYNGKPIANELKALKNEMANVIRKKIYKSIPDTNIRQAYLDYGNLENLAKWGQEAMTGSKLKGGAGGFISAIKDMVLTPVTTIGGKVLYKTGEGLEFIGKKGAKKVKDIIDDGFDMTSSGTKNVKIPKSSLTSSNEVLQNTLENEARKYKTAEEFVKFMRGSATQYGEYNPKLRAKIGLFEDSARLSDLGIDPNKEITIYRGIDGNIKGAKINDGDFITTDLESAKGYSSGKVISKKVKAKDLIADSAKEFDVNDAFNTGAEFIYSDSKNKLTNYTKSQLTDIWKKANKK